MNNDQLLVIHNVDEALAALKLVVENENYRPDNIKFSGEITSLKVKIQGEKYHGTFPATFARELWTVQEEFYRAFLSTLGRPEHINNLTADEKDLFLITFHVQEGCIEFKALFDKSLDALTEIISTMDSKDKLITVLGTVLIISTGYFVNDGYNHKKDTELKAIEHQHDLDKEKERTEQLKIFKEVALHNPHVNRFSQAMENSSQAILRGAVDADSLSIGSSNYSRDDIENAKKRTPRASTVESRFTDDYLILSTDFRHPDSTKYTIRDSKGHEFPIIVDHTRFKDENLNKLHSAASKREKINLTLDLLVKREVIKSADLVSVN